jgi:hypothetical protein
MENFWKTCFFGRSILGLWRESGGKWRDESPKMPYWEKKVGEIPGFGSGQKFWGGAHPLYGARFHYMERVSTIWSVFPLFGLLFPLFGTHFHYLERVSTI